MKNVEAAIIAVQEHVNSKGGKDTFPSKILEIYLSGRNRKAVIDYLGPHSQFYKAPRLIANAILMVSVLEGEDMVDWLKVAFEPIDNYWDSNHPDNREIRASYAQGVLIGYLQTALWLERCVFSSEAKKMPEEEKEKWLEIEKGVAAMICHGVCWTPYYDSDADLYTEGLAKEYGKTGNPGVLHFLNLIAEGDHNDYFDGWRGKILLNIHFGCQSKIVETSQRSPDRIHEIMRSDARILQIPIR